MKCHLPPQCFFVLALLETLRTLKDCWSANLPYKRYLFIPTNTMPATRSHAATTPSCATRKRKATDFAHTAKQIKKTRTAQGPDELYLQRAIKEFSKQRGYPKEAQRPEILERTLGYLRRFEVPKAGDAYSPETVEAARRLLASDEPIGLPVFVGDAANWSMIERDSDRRPIEQLFDFLHDPDEVNECNDEATPGESERKTLSITELKTLFVDAHRHAPRYPHNFPDIVNPMLDNGMPRFLQNAQCTLLHDIMRRQLDCAPKDLCVCDDKGEESAHCDHHIRREEFHELHNSWQYWPGTVMLAEPGSITYPHWDKYATSTWISCLEGEIAFGWQSKPKGKALASWLEDLGEPRGRWCFRVLRPGEVVYMPPGTVHLVFRRPGGGQTMGFAGQMLRRADTLDWLKFAKIEVSYADAVENAPYEFVLPPLVNGFLELVNAAAREGDFAKFGGKQKIREMTEIIEEMGDLIEQLKESKRKEADGTRE